MNKYFYQPLSRRGFTLIELMVVIAIIGVLAAAVGGNYITSRIRARDAERKAGLSQLQNAFEVYFNDYGYYPESIDGKPLGLEWGTSLVDDNGTVYMSQMPQDPRSPTATYFYEADGLAASDTDQFKYRIYTRLENMNDLDTDLDNDGQPGDEYDTSVGDGSAKSCGSVLCNYGVPSTTTTMEEVW